MYDLSNLVTSFGARLQEQCWKEVIVEDISRSWLEFRVFDHDGITVEFMGSARIKSVWAVSKALSSMRRNHSMFSPRTLVFVFAHPAAGRLGPHGEDRRHVLRRQWLYLDRTKRGYCPSNGLVSPDSDHDIGRICVSIVFRPITVDDNTFAYGWIDHANIKAIGVPLEMLTY